MMKKIFFLMFLFGIVSSTAFAQDETDPESLADYKIACLAGIENIDKIRGGINLDMWESLAFNTAVAGAKAGLDECETTDAMNGVMVGLRAFTTAMLQTKGKFNDGLVFTGLIGNQSFDTGDLSSWSTIGFDLDKVDVNQVTNDIINNGDVSGLLDVVSINEWKENTRAVTNQGENSMSGGHNKYYLNSDNQLIMQPIIGLPAGVYSFSAKVATPTWGQTNVFIPNNVFLNALVIPVDVAQEFLGYDFENNLGIDYSSIPISELISAFSTGDFSQVLNKLFGLSGVSGWKDVLSNTSKIWENIEPLLQFGKLYSGAVAGKGIDVFTNAEMRFMIDEGDIVILGINAGITQFIGAEAYRADNLRLTGLRSVGEILTAARADLAAAAEEMSPIEANYNADVTDLSAQAAFTYDKTITEYYNNAYLAVKNQKTKRLKDIVTQADLDDLDVVDEKLNQYTAKIASDIEALKAAKETFDKNAFIAPVDGDLFNILMKDETPGWAGNAVTIDEDMAMHFSEKPGKSAFTLAFSFEKASDVYKNKLYAYVDDGQTRYYVGAKEGSLALTTDKALALPITATPSYTTEGELTLMAGGMYLGTTTENNLMVPTNEEGQLTALSVSPAAEMRVIVTIPTGRNVGTAILPFDAVFPYAGVSACAVTGFGEDLPYLETENVTSFKANTPYCVMAGPGKYTFTGVSRALKPSYGDGPLIGRFASYTTQGGNEYKMTVDEADFIIFRRADGMIIPEFECYLKTDYPNDVIFFRQADAVTGIDDIQTGEMVNGKCYDLSGRRIDNSKLSHGIYIQDGKKVLR